MKQWGGRFQKPSNEDADQFHSSFAFDRRLAEQDILGSLAHAQMLGTQRIISKEECFFIRLELLKISLDIRSGAITFDQDAEDIHTFIETLLIERVGEAGKKLHTGRSRNDQVALDMRMYIREEIREIGQSLITLLGTLLKIAKENIHTIMPGYTHMQRAQPVTLAHHMLAYIEMLKRDRARLSDAGKRMNVMPLGAGALAATTYPLNREQTREDLGFDSITLNSLDAVSDRDFCLELLSCFSILMMHLSRFCEELVLWSSYEFRFVEMDDAYATGSSIMPQKKNPDMAELIRGKTGRVYGHLMGLLTVMKGLPLSYNTDMQEDKESVFDAIDTIKNCLTVFNGMIATVTFNKENMREACADGFVNATDAADWLVKQGMPFRDAHEVIGKLTVYCIEQQKTLEQLSLEEYRGFSPIFNEDIYSAIALTECVNARRIPGGPAASAVQDLIRRNELYLKDEWDDENGD